MHYLVIADVLESVTDHADTHVNKVTGCYVKHVLGELLTVLVDFLQWK